MKLKILDKYNDQYNLQKVLEGAPKYSLNISGKLQDKSAAVDIFNAKPDQFDYSKKFVLGIYINDELIGVIDLLKGFPDNETIMLGLLLLVENRQGQGLGKKSFNELLIFLKQWPEIKKIRISVVLTNSEVLEFWKKLGFTEIGVHRPYQNGRIISETTVLEMLLK